ncbi:uncharacterized protein LOC128554344 [Mercenaria mercenaria]|uniref:uncharacterized protein LOC128554344 n=1 Tax=Mercenaria mercenaria TaxID=6596 RepID=UPI00234F526D|nr:uncharacterized protein LOC128554344 [Mercenaria mercenaria]
MLGVLSTQELQDAEQMLLRDCQENAYPDELSYLKSPTSCIPRPTLVNQLQLFQDGNGLLRCGGRIQNAPVAESTKFPYLLPKKHLLTRLIVQHAHEKYLHAGMNATVTNIRQKYWILAIRQCVNAITRKCVTCRRVIGRPYSAPDPPQFPKIRVENAPPFTVTGVDFTGAIQTKNNTGTTSKAYICLFMCAATRAIHLEVVTDLSESTFMQALRRFVSRKSLPKVMVSDNATTYQSAAATSLRKLFQSASVRTSLSEMGTEWRFIPKRAPWYGGFWERLIGLTKVTLKKIIGRADVTLETLQTITTEAECMINNRPLTHVPSSPDDPRPLTPAHLLYGRQTTSLPYSNDIDATNCDVTSDHTSLTMRARMQQTLIDHFRRRWMSEYLTALLEHHQKTECNAKTIKVGEVVLIHDDSPRIRWKLGLVDELLTGMDGLTRAVKLRTTTGVTSRPIVKLYPLEVGSVPATDDITEDV